MGVRRPLIGVATAAALWEVIGRSGIVPKYLFPPFTEVVKALAGAVLDGSLVAAYLVTLARVLAGFTLGSVAGVFIGVALYYSRTVRDSIYPLLSFLASTPVVAMVPLLMVWVGLNEALPVVAVFLCSFTPVVLNTVSGGRGVDPDVVKVAKTLGASDSRILLTVVLPLSLPSVLSALKIEAAMVWKTCFVVEMVALSSGLGYYMILAESALRVDLMLAALLVLAASTYAFYTFFEYLEVKLLRKWGYGARW